MTAWFRRLPIRQKLIAMILLTSGVVVGLASAGQMIAGYMAARQDAASDLQAQGRIILENAVGFMAFNDVEAGSATLYSLQSNPNVRTACLYGEKDNLFAEYRQPDSVGCPLSAPPVDGSTFEGNRIVVAQSRVEGTKRVASILLRSDVTAVEERLRQQAAILMAVMLVTLGVATLLSAMLQRLVSEPVAELSRAAATVSSRGDYSVRATRRTDDELGVLVDAFNGMLERIQMREHELSKANDDLRREVGERRRAEQERAELLVREREANRLKDEFLATLSHELRTPLNAILGWTKMLRAGALPPESAERALEKVERNAQVQARLVEDLLEVSRITTGKLRLEVRELDLITLANTAVDSIRPTAEARGVRIDRDFGAASLPTAGDPDRLQQVIWNLLSNAVKFTPAEGRVTLQVHRRGDVDELVVSDTGIGIDHAFLPNVFDTFRQADASATRAHGGLGLGLSIVRHLVEVHGGVVAAASPGANRGATFTVRLPVRSLPKPLPRPAGPQETGGLLDGFTLVVVDDDTDTRELLQSVLETAGAMVHAASSADEAADACRRHQADALVTDIGMPGRDGYSLLEQLQRDHLAPRVAVALSAYAGPGDRQRSLEAGFVRHVAKPVDPASLVRTLRDLLEERVAEA